MAARFYILKDDKTPTTVESVVEWGRWMEARANRRVALTEIAGAVVSTVFLGLDHNFGESGPPVLFETMIYNLGSPEWDHQNRYTTWDKAMTGHELAVEWVRSVIDLAEADTKSMLNKLGEASCWPD